MMMGFGSYGIGGGSSSSASNLSALAPPFTVDRSVSKPLVDLTEPPLNWLNTHPLSFDSMHSSNAYGYTFNPPSATHVPPPENTIPITSTDSFLYGQNSDVVPSTNLVEAKPYYPSYVSPTRYTYDDYAQSLSGLWDGTRGWEFDKKIDFGECFSSKEMNMPDLSIYQNYTDQGAHSSKGLNTYEQNTNSIDMLGGQQHQGSTYKEPLDYKSFPGKISEFMPVYSGKSGLGSTSLYPDTYSLTSCEQGRSGNHQTPYGASHEKGAKQHSISQNDTPSLVIRSQAVGSGPSAPNPSSFNSLENGSNANNTDFAGSDNFFKMKDFHPLQSSVGKVHFDASQVSFPPDGGIHCFRELPLEKKEKLVSNVKVNKDTFSEKSGLQIPDIDPGYFSYQLASNGGPNCLEGSSESLDHYNLAVDSPCWKGSPIYHFPPLENSGPVSPQLIKKLEGGSNCSFYHFPPPENSGPVSPQLIKKLEGGSHYIEPIDNPVKFSSQKPSNYSLCVKNSCLENDSESCPKRPSLSNLLFEEHGYDHELKAGSCNMKLGCGLGVQFSDYIDKPSQDYILANNSVDEFKFKPFHSMRQNSIEDKLTFNTNCKLGTDVADVGMSTNDAIEGCSSHAPLHATEHVLSSPSSVEPAPSKLTKFEGEELAPQICVRTLISTLHNLSELLLLHCSNDVCEWNKNDLVALKQVVNNLDKCTSKTMGPEAPLRESLLTQKSSQFIREFPELNEGVTMSRPLETKAAFSVLNPFNYQHVQEERVRHTVSYKKVDECSDFTSGGGDGKRVKDDNMTQAIKKVLCENFIEEEDEKVQILLYKNLWLEAEAAFCSINYKARFDRMKLELEKSKLLKAKENTSELEKLSQSTFSPDLNTVNKFPPEVKYDSTQDASVQDFRIASTISHPDNVLARFHILKCQESNANQRTTADVEKISSHITSDDVDKLDKIASEAKNNQTQHISTCSLPSSSSTSHTDDVEASVMARFHILRNRIENSSCANMSNQLLPQVTDLGFAGEGQHGPENGSLDVSLQAVLQQNSANRTQDKLTVKEFHLHGNDDSMIQSPRVNRLGNQLPASSYDSSSSDWEHIWKEDLPVPNS